MHTDAGSEGPYRHPHGASSQGINLSSICPFCGGETEIERELDPELGPVSLDELETLVRNEWRRRLGSPAYAREHSRTIIRALIVYALAPESPIRGTVPQQLIWWELVTLGTWGMDRGAIDQEFQELIHAVRAVLSRAGLQADRVLALADHIETKLRETLEWPELTAQDAHGHDRLPAPRAEAKNRRCS